MRQRSASWSGPAGLDDRDGRQNAPAVPHVEAPVRHGHAMGRAADRVSDVLRACQGWLGVDTPRCGRERCTQRGAGPGEAQGCGAHGACL